MLESSEIVSKKNFDVLFITDENLTIVTFKIKAQNFLEKKTILKNP